MVPVGPSTNKHMADFSHDHCRGIMSAEASGIWATRLGSVACGNVAGAAGVAVGCAVSAALPSMFKQRYQVAEPHPVVNGGSCSEP